MKNSDVYIITGLSIAGLSGAYYYYYKKKKEAESVDKKISDASKNLSTLIASAKTNSLATLESYVKHSDPNKKTEIEKLVKEIKEATGGLGRQAISEDNYAAAYLTLKSAIVSHDDDIIAPLSVRWSRCNPWKGNSGLSRIYSMCGVVDPQNDPIDKSVFINFCNYNCNKVGIKKEDLVDFDACNSEYSKLSLDKLLDLSFEVEAAVMLYTASLISNTSSTYTTTGEYAGVDFDPAYWSDFWSSIKEVYIDRSTSDLSKNMQLMTDLYYLDLWGTDGQ